MESRNSELEQRLNALEAEVEQVNGEREELLEKNDRNQRRVKRWKQFGIGLFVALVFTLISVYAPVREVVKNVSEWIARFGGVWSFGNLALNLINTKRH